MKRVFFVLLLTLITASQTFAQKKTPLQICTELLNAQVFVEYAKFKKGFEQTNKDLAPKLQQKDFDDLNLAYNLVQKDYDNFLGEIQKDLQDINAIKKMAKDPSGFVNTYSAAYQDVISTYNTDYIPLYNNLKSKNAKPIPPIIAALAPKLIAVIVDLIQKREDLKQEHISNILEVVNSYFFEKLRMKKWHELNLKPAPSTPTQNGTNINTTPNANSGTPGDRTAANSIPLPPALNEPSPVNPPVFNKLEGFVEFIVMKADNSEEKMNFVKKAGKDIIITSRKVNNGQVQTQNNAINTDYLTSELAYPEGTQYYIKVNNSAGLYILTLNSDKTISTLYPCAVDAANPIPGSSSTMSDYKNSKDLIIAKRNTNPVAGQDINGFTVFPTPDFTTKPPMPNYFTMTGQQTTPENFCIILSKSVLDIDLFAKQLAKETGNMDERLAKVLKADAMSFVEGQVVSDGNKVSFNALTSNKSVLPLVFYIKR